MSTTSLTPSPRSRSNRLGAWAAAAVLAAGPAAGQQIVFDPRNHLENALQASRQLESLANEARSLAASPYSHLVETRQSLADLTALARSAQGLAGSIESLEERFRALYPDDLSGAARDQLRSQAAARRAETRRTAEAVARTAAELERLGRERGRRVGGALAASETAAGQTAAVQSTNQMLAVLAEDLSALQILLTAQSRLMAEAAARDAADREAGDAARARRWAAPSDRPPAPAFTPLPNARN